MIAMSEIIFRTEPGSFQAAPLWLIERQPEGVTDPMVVRFRKTSKGRKLLDVNARWTPLGWDRQRWVPTAPLVPKHLLEIVTAHLLIMEIHG